MFVKKRLKIGFLLLLFLGMCFFLFSINKEINSYKQQKIKTTTSANEVSLQYTGTIVKVPILIQNIQKEGPSLSYTYTIRIEKVTGVVLATYQNETISLNFDEHGIATFSLQSNEKIVLQDIPIDVVYSVSQEENTSVSSQIEQTDTSFYQGITKAENTVTFQNTMIQTVANPYTVDVSFICFLLCICSFLLLFFLKHLKIKKYSE